MRVPAHDVEPMFLRRTSPRAMNGQPVSTTDLFRLLEAARWAPSSSNGQPWRFVYAVRGTPAFDALLASLVDANRVWCERAGALVLLCSKDTFDSGRPNPHARFDAGAAWMSLALQASFMGLVSHAMAGFDADKAAAAVHLPEGHSAICAIAIGHHGNVDDLPEKLRPREVPTDRHPLTDFAFDGAFPPPAAPAAPPPQTT